MTPVLVTGGSGFIGQHLVSALHAKGRRVRILDLRGPARPLPDIQHVSGSVLDAAAVDEALVGVAEVYHLAGLPGMWMPDKNDFHAVNCRGTEIMLEAARKRGIGRFLHEVWCDQRKVARAQPPQQVVVRPPLRAVTVCRHSEMPLPASHANK